MALLKLSANKKVLKEMYKDNMQLLLAAPTSISQTIPRHGLHQDASPCFRHVACGILQRRFRRITKIHY